VCLWWRDFVSNGFVRLCSCWDGVCLCVVRVCVFPVFVLCVCLF